MLALLLSCRRVLYAFFLEIIRACESSGLVCGFTDTCLGFNPLSLRPFFVWLPTSTKKKKEKLLTLVAVMEPSGKNLF